MSCCKDTEIEDTKAYLLRPDYVHHRLGQSFVRGESYGYPATDGTYWSVLKSHLLSEHSLLGVFFAHREHPFSRMERFWFLFSAMAMLFMLQAAFHSSDPNGGEEQGYVNGFVVTLIVVPYKKFLRYVMECPCLYDSSYNPDAFEGLTDKEFDAEDMKRLGARAVEGCGSLISCANIAFALIVLIIGIVLVAEVANGDEFAISWIYAQALSLVGTECFMIAVFTYLAVNVPYCGFSEKLAFEEKWGHLFPKDKPPVSYTDVAALAKWNFIIMDPNGGQEMFDKYFSDYDLNFGITPDIDEYYKAWKEAERDGKETPLQASAGESDALTAAEEGEAATEVVDVDVGEKD